jgi:hypothetical protein
MATYTSSGSVKVGGCALASYGINRYFAHPIGSTRYVKPKALKGVLEKIVVKAVRMPKAFDPTRTRMGHFGDLSPLYVDTFNALFVEEELISKTDALVYIEQFELRVRAEKERLAMNCR